MPDGKRLKISSFEVPPRQRKRQPRSQEPEPWYPDDGIVSRLSDKTKALVRILRDGYRIQQLRPQEREERERRIRMWVKNLRERGCVVNDGSTDTRNSVII